MNLKGAFLAQVKAATGPAQKAPSVLNAGFICLMILGLGQLLSFNLVWRPPLSDRNLA